ncbi:MAG: VWA domain-containing protein [Desulfobacteraceae bacterium]|nr:MAG: VWA domain-containing protein [Desulfobacteraceae bacterium]
MFRFASPVFFCCFFALAGILVYRFRTRYILFLRVAGFSEQTPVPHSILSRMAQWIDVLKILAIILLIFALARPQWGNQKINVMTEGVNIILALDLSNSMQALDFKRDGKIVDRLEAVKSVVADFILKRSGDRIGMVVFGSNAFTQLPLTRDYNTISFILEKLEIGSAGPSTAIGDAIGISLKRLEDIQSKSNIIILLTDGKSNAGELSWEDAADIAAQRGVKIYTIAVGTKGEAPFRVKGLFGDQFVYKRVDVDFDALETIASKTSGSFFKAQDTKGLKQIYDMIDNLEKTKVKVDKWVEYKELYLWFVIPGIALLCLYILLANTRLIRIP